jgi:hypothetical protein
LFASAIRKTKEWINMIGVTVGVGRWRQTAELAAAAARKHTGLKIVVLADAEWARLGGRYGTPHYLKLHLFEFVDDDHIFYFDADAIHINDWNPAEFAGCGAVVAAIDPFIGQLAEESGVPSEQYFNAGVMILNRCPHESFLLQAQQLAASGLPSTVAEQTHLNKARQLCGLGLECLPSKFNHLRFYDDPNFDPCETVIAHWTPHSDEDIGTIEATLRAGAVVTMKTAARAAQGFIERIPDSPLAEYEGRGIVICAGGTKYLPSAWVLVRMLRHLDCTLPIQVWYRGDEERDESWIDLVKPFGVECVDAYSFREQHPHPRLGGWELKPYAVLHSPFREVMLLDADNVPVRDPSYLFDASEYLETGALFWPDAFRMSPSDPCWKAFDVEFRDERNFESGQMLIDKARGWRPLVLCDWYNQHSYFYYRIVYGDKDTFRFAWRRLAQPFAMPERDAGAIHHTILQYDPGSELIFQHRHGDKWRLSGNRRLPGFVHEALCSRFVAELDAKWNPMAAQLRTMLSDSDRALMATLAGQPRYQLSLAGRCRWVVRLSETGRAIGAGPFERYWWCRDGQLFFSALNGREPTALTLRPDGSWRGVAAYYGGSELRLVKSRQLPQRSSGKSHRDSPHQSLTAASPV